MTPAPEAYTLGSLNIASQNTKCYPGRSKKIRILSNGVIGRKAKTCRRCGGTDHIR
ncbi:hypothetical protein HID58_065928 [Brassica napus]|uniref:Uncharacterized protein n=1 Tax=Brassica napus TaxID=3708 RepID=A0ABQ7ZE88_BRANA|nr:hypothetical protein HID58_065928 [Brassica napus]